MSDPHSDESDPLIGCTFGNYRVIRQLGQGGMGAVYLAEQPLIGKRVAIKVLHPQYATVPEVLRRFFHEARLVNQIRHEHIVDVIDFANDADGRPYLVMELLEGESLRTLLGRGPLDERSARAIGAQVGRALAAAHGIDVVHRDLKPDNVFLVRRESSEWFIKLLDFGIAKVIGDEGVKERLTRTGAVIGTPLYMSPEQIEGRPVGPGCDIYALGCILFQMVVGRPPFPADDGLTALLAAHLMKPPPLVSQVNANVSSDYERIVLTCMAKAPAARFTRASDLAVALESGVPPPGVSAKNQPTSARIIRVVTDADLAAPSVTLDVPPTRPAFEPPPTVPETAIQQPEPASPSTRPSGVTAIPRNFVLLGGGILGLLLVLIAVAWVWRRSVSPPGGEPPVAVLMDAQAAIAEPLTLPAVAPEDALPAPSANVEPPAPTASHGHWKLASATCQNVFAPRVTVSASGNQVVITAPNAPALSGTTDANGMVTLRNALGECTGHVSGRTANITCTFTLMADRLCAASYRLE